MNETNIFQPLADSGEVVWGTITSFLPQLILALAIFILAWLVGGLLGRALGHVFTQLPIDKALRNAGVHDFFKKAEINFSVAHLIGGLVKWFIIIIGLVLALNVLGLEQLNAFLTEVLFFIPDIFVAVVVLMLASVVANVVAKIVKGSAKAAGITTGAFLASVAKWAIWIFALLIALVQLRIAPQLINVLFIGVVSMFALAGGLAFGLGGKESAKRVLEGMSRSMHGYN